MFVGPFASNLGCKNPDLEWIEFNQLLNQMNMGYITKFTMKGFQCMIKENKDEGRLAFIIEPIM